MKVRNLAIGSACVLALAACLVLEAPTRIANEVSLRFGADPPAATVVAAFVGDSYTAGTGASVPSRRWSSLVAGGRGWSESNFGRGGTGYLVSAGPSGCPESLCSEYIGRLPYVVPDRPEVVVLAGGQNDLRAFKSDAEAGSAKIRQTFAETRRLFPDATIVAVGPSSPAGPTPTFVSLDSAVRAGAAAVGATYISLLDPPVIERSMLLSDEAHVGDVGHRAIADRILEHLVQALPAQ